MNPILEALLVGCGVAFWVVLITVAVLAGYERVLAIVPPAATADDSE